MATLGVHEHPPRGVAILSILHTFVSYYYLFIPAFLLILILKRRYLSPLRHYPGPLLASFTRLWKLNSVYNSHCELDRIRIHDQYGPIVRIAPNELSLSSPIAAREVLSAGKGFHKTDFYSVFPPPENPDIFTEIRENVHAQKKRVAATPYSLNAMQKLTPFIEDTIELLMQKLDAFAVPPPPTNRCNLGDWLHFFAFDVLGEVAFSKKYGFLEQGIDVENTIKAIDDAQWYDGIIGQIPWLDFLFRRNPLWAYVPFLSTKKPLVTRMALQEMGRRKPFGDTAGKKDTATDREDLLSQLIRGHLSSPDRFSEGDVFAVAHGAIFAGSDSTASTMQSFFFLVLQSPAIYHKICTELNSTTFSSPTPTWTEAQQQLPYFQAALKETMRLRPAVGLDITRHVPRGGADVDGVKIPGGTRVAVNAWVLHRNESIFGSDAHTFRPERWLEDADRAKVMERYMFQFGGGSHLCIGRNLALLEINLVLPRLLREYTFELVQPSRPIEYHTTFFVVQEGLEVWIRKRDRNESGGGEKV